MDRFSLCCVMLAAAVSLPGCSDNGMGVSVAGEAELINGYSQRPAHIQQALQRAAQLSTEPAKLVALCEMDLATLDFPDQKSMVRALNACVENAGME